MNSYEEYKQLQKERWNVIDTQYKLDFDDPTSREKNKTLKAKKAELEAKIDSHPCDKTLTPAQIREILSITQKSHF